MSGLLSRSIRPVAALAIACSISIGPLAASVGATNVSANETSKNETAKETNNKKQRRSSARLPAEGTHLGMMFIPRLKMRSVIVEGVTDLMFDQGMGHWPGTAMPGERGNAVYGGHRTSGPAPLYYVERLKVGDPIIILKGLKKVEYRVISKRIVKPTALWITHQSSGSTLTIFSCHPRGSTKQRYVIQALLKK